MPTYQYRCTSCGHDLEAVQKFSDAALTECPNCGGPLRKVFNAVGVVFKGSGFYRTDSRSGKGEDGSGGGSKDSDKGKDAGGGKSDGGTKESTPAKEASPAKEPVASATSSTGGSTTK
jgi:putative FmdB family regulatory protein